VIFFSTVFTILEAFLTFFIRFEEFIYYIGSIFAPLVAILIVRYIYGEKRVVLPEALEGIGLISWVIGIFASILAIKSLGFGATVITTVCRRTIIVFHCY